MEVLCFIAIYPSHSLNSLFITALIGNFTLTCSLAFWYKLDEKFLKMIKVILQYNIVLESCKSLSQDSREGVANVPVGKFTADQINRSNAA